LVAAGEVEEIADGGEGEQGIREWVPEREQRGEAEQRGHLAEDERDD
jgi:hypothetical protein